jgi:DNA-binding transcriptional ArsR family regulator
VLDRCTVMQHLGVLERAGLLIARREGRHRWNYLNAAPFQDIYDRWISPYATEAVALLARLKNDLENA